MGDQTREFEHESLQDRVAVARYLDALKEGFDNGSLSLSNGAGEILLEPNGLVELTIKASRDRGRMQISLKATWKETKDNGPTETLSIIPNGN